jgi:hypothetical protein
MPFRLATYLLNRVRYPHLEDFCDLGLGIEARYQRNRKLWETHLSLSKKFIEKSLAHVSGGKLVVLGSGRLFDLPFQQLRSQFDEIHLYDADPSSKAIALRKVKNDPKVVFHLEDITGSLELWEEAVRCCTRRQCPPSDLLSIFENLSPVMLSLQGDAIISLNILSQLGFHWRGRVDRALHGYQASLSIDALEERLQRTSALLEEAHCKLLSQSGAKEVVLLSDSEFHFYRKNSAPWESEDALSTQFPDDLPGYMLSDRDSWLWHIVREGTERGKNGEIHTVQARHFQRRLK